MNTAIIGCSGAGKTQFTKSMVTQLIQNQQNNVGGNQIGLLIFDYKPDYIDEVFIAATSARVLEPVSIPYNPLSLYGDLPNLPILTARGFSEALGKAYNLGVKQKTRLRYLVMNAYENFGIHSQDKSTWKNPAPTIQSVYDLFMDESPVEDSLFAALADLADLNVFESNPNKVLPLYELLNGVVVIKLAEYPEELQSLIVALTLDLFYTQMQKNGKPLVDGDFRQITKLILVDEADNFMSQNFIGLRKLLKEGREYGVGTILSTQDITHFKTTENDYATYMQTWVVHQMKKVEKPHCKLIFNVSDKKEQERLALELGQLEKHHSLYVDGNKNIRKIRDLAFWELVK